MSTTSPCAIFNSARDSSAFLPVRLTDIWLSRSMIRGSLPVNLIITKVMNRKSFLLGLSAAGVVPFVSGHSLVHTLDSEAGTPVMLAPDLNNSYWYIGTLISILLSAKDTGGAFSLMHGYEIQGLEPPPHIHTREDESFYILEGEIIYTAGDRLLKATRGSWVFLPRNIEHSFRVITPRAEVLIHLSPGGFEKYFIEMSEPAAELVIPPMPQGPPDVRRIVETASRYGIRFPGIQ